MESPPSSHYNIPVVDMGALGLGKADECAGPKEWQRVSQELHDALSTIGFVYLSNHGIPETQFNNLVDASISFFKLDEETKMKYKADVSKKSHGYIGMDMENLDKTGKFSELRESYYMKDSDDVFPDGAVPQLRPLADTFITSCKSLAHKILTALALALDLDKDFFVNKHRGMCADSPLNSTVLRVNHYPPLPDNAAENMIRCGAHTDYGSITLLFQDSMGGLQVRNMDGEWVDARPIPGTILINVGDLLQVWTANKLVATEHRVVIPKEEVVQKRSRCSTAFFVHPDCEVILQPIGADPSLSSSSSSPPMTARQYLLSMYSKTFA